MKHKKKLNTKKLQFVLGWICVFTWVCTGIYAIYARDFGALITLIIIGIPSINSVYKGITGLKSKVWF